jgi:uncharacterized protein YkwD
LKSSTKVRRALASVVLLLCGGCATPPSVRLAASPPDPGTLMPALERRIYELVDEDRHRLQPGTMPLVLDSELVGVAREKSADMAARNHAAHRAPDGHTTADIIMQKDAEFQGLLGENIAVQPFVAGYAIDVDAIAHRVVETWLASAPHRDNLADPAYNRTGVGAAATRDAIYVTELFAADLTGAPPHR